MSEACERIIGPAMTPANVGAMGRKPRGVLAVFAAVVIVAAFGGCGDKAAKEATNPPSSPAASGAAAQYASTLRDRVKALEKKNT